MHGVFSIHIESSQSGSFQFLPVQDGVRQSTKSWSDILEPCIAEHLGKWLVSAPQCTTKLSLFNVRHDLGGVD